MPKIYLALYKGRKKGKGLADIAGRFSDWVVRTYSRSDYSHCEISIPIGGNLYSCYSSSGRDGGVRRKVMPLPPDKWDLIEIDSVGISEIKSFFTLTRGDKYDWLGVIGFPFGFNDKRRWFCSEWCACVLGIQNTRRYSPASLGKFLMEG